MGTPDFSVPSLQALLAHETLEVVGVVTAPDRPAGRGKTLRESPVKQAAVEAGVPVLQPKTLRTPEAIANLQGWAPDVIVTAATSHILRPDVLDLPPHGCVNVHASLLPRWRGAAPIQAAIRAGDASSGVTIMRSDPGIDTGPLIATRKIPLDPRETASTLHDKLAALGGELLAEALPAYLGGEIEPQPQPDDEALVTYAPKISKEDGEIDWTQPVDAIDRLVRAFDPWPGTFTAWNGQTFKVLAAHPAGGAAEPGRVVEAGGAVAVGTGEGLLALDVVQLEGRKALDTAAFANGQPDFIGSVLG
jgi:methionyl-tRNA formyltransferase